MRVALIRLLILTLSLAASAFARSAEAGSPRPSCGLAALSELCRREGLDVGIDRLAEELGPMPEHGYSMAQLARAAGEVGLRLQGVRVGPDDRLPDRPFLAHATRDGEGHFFVIVPLQQPPTRVLVIDPAGGYGIVRFDRLARSPGWTGIVLIREAELPALAPAAILGLSVLILACRFLAGKATRRRRTPTAVLVPTSNLNGPAASSGLE